jgi:hypothetical protein
MIVLQNGVQDSYTWRKYGQKEILGARFPRYLVVSHMPNSNELNTHKGFGATERITSGAFFHGAPYHQVVV